MARQKKNYQKELDHILAGMTREAPRLFLHACCAPCSSYVLEYLSEYFEITVFYYNPNISPEEEYRLRTAEVQRLISEMNPRHPIHFVEGEYNSALFYEAVRGLEKEPEGGARCEKCFRLRLYETARLAKEGGYDYFATTLTISPLKNAALLNEIGEEAAKEFGVPFLPSDFKKRGGYQRSIELSREHGLYRQDFCGCVFSQFEAEARKRKRRAKPESPAEISAEKPETPSEGENAKIKGTSPGSSTERNQEVDTEIPEEDMIVSDELVNGTEERYERIFVRIDLDAVRHNVLSILKNAGRKEGFMAVVKADAYGHGASEVAREVAPLVWGFAVATPDEALSLRRHGITKPILVLGHVMENRFREMIRPEIRSPVFEPARAESLSKTALAVGKKALVHIKVDTGMHRIGLFADDKGFQDAVSICSLPGIEAEGIFTHLATADMVENTAALRQIDDFRAFVKKLRDQGFPLPLAHYANSAASILFDCADSALLRVGIALYGLNPSDECDYSAADLRPALSWYSEISYVKTLPAGMPISYGGTFVSDREMRVATVSAGYADGYPRSLSNRGEVLVGGRRCRILGRVCMDQFMIDVSDVPEAREGMRVTLIGREGKEEITADELGAVSGRFNYELVCDISKRVPRIFIKDGMTVFARDSF
ncbi:MAG: alanine racemase [Lachnospiraceae bacterium]|nr:alanine racemase [Lachnospiraceae bacterium]